MQRCGNDLLQPVPFCWTTTLLITKAKRAVTANHCCCHKLMLHLEWDVWIIIHHFGTNPLFMALIFEGSGFVFDAIGCSQPLEKQNKGLKFMCGKSQNQTTSEVVNTRQLQQVLGKINLFVACSREIKGGEGRKAEGHRWDKGMWHQRDEPTLQWLRDSNEFALLSRKYINTSQHPEPSQEPGEVKCSKFSIFPSWETFQIPMGMSENRLHLG